MLPLSPRERRAGHALLAAFLLFIILPYLWAWAITPPGFHWGGILFSADDPNVHLMWARQAQDGAFFVRDLFTTEGLISGARPLFFNVLALVMGCLSRLTGMEVGFSYHIIRVAGAAWALWQLHLLSWTATQGDPDRENARLWTLALAAFTTGAGFLALALPQLLQSVILFDRADNLNWPLMPEAFLILSALLYPLNIVAFGLLALIVRHILDGKWWPTFIGAALLANIHTYDALPLVVLALVWALWQWKGDRAGALRALSAVAGAAIPVGYQLLVFRDSTEFRIKALTLTPPPALRFTLLSMAPLLLLAVVGWFALHPYKRQRNLLALWALATLALVYVPTSVFSFARKMIEGFQLPLLVLGGAGLASLKRPFLAALLVVVMALSPLETLGWILNNAQENNASRWKLLMPVLYLRDSEVGALSAINASQQAGAVLCLPFIGAYVPRATGKYAYAGHWAETLYLQDVKLPQLGRFYRNQMAPDEARAWLHANGIRWVMVSFYERGFSDGAPGPQALGLQAVYNSGMGDNRTVVYAVT